MRRESPSTLPTPCTPRTARLPAEALVEAAGDWASPRALAMVWEAIRSEVWRELGRT